MNIITLASLQSFTVAYKESDLFGKLIILSLIAVSIVCWIVLVYKIWQVKKVSEISSKLQALVEKNKNQLLNISLDKLPETSHQNIPNPYRNILKVLQSKTLETLNKKMYFSEQQGLAKDIPLYLSSTDLELLESHVYTTISVETKVLEKDLFILSTSVTLAPFLGLLGTVWGILVTFSELQAGSSAGSNTAIIGGLSTALSTTVLGLVIAIPALIAYNYLKNNLRMYTSDMEDFLHNLISTLELQYRKVDIS